MNYTDVMEIIQKVFEVLLDVSKWLNSNIFSNIGTVMDVLKTVIDFIKDLFSEGGFLADLFSGDFNLGEAIKGLFG